MEGQTRGIMAITVPALTAALRASDSTHETELITRLLSVCRSAVTRYAPDAPEDVRDQALIQAAGYLYDMPPAERGAGYARYLRNSGAAALLNPYKARNIGICD